ncbi:MAG: ABC transporter permease [Clostridia bacterium]|nr:ABC transporter permease [Clostridia bacterium]
MNIKFEKNTFEKRIKSMLAVDFRRMFTSPLFYLMVGISLVIPILILVMTTMMDGSVSVNPQTGEETIMEGFKNVWQIIGSISGDSSTMSMDITSMCNINMMFFLIAVFVCIFVSDDFRSGYSKNLFTVRANKTDYIISKSIVGFIAGASMLIAFFIGAMLGGAFSGLTFALESVTIGNIVMSMLSKIFLVSIFSSIYLLASVIAKQRLWMSLLISFGIGMLFFTMIPIITPLNAGIMNVILCLVGGGLFAFGIGVGSYFILKKTNIL